MYSQRCCDWLDSWFSCEQYFCFDLPSVIGYVGTVGMCSFGLKRNVNGRNIFLVTVICSLRPVGMWLHCNPEILCTSDHNIPCTVWVLSFSSAM